MTAALTLPQAAELDRLAEEIRGHIAEQLNPSGWDRLVFELHPVDGLIVTEMHVSRLGVELVLAARGQPLGALFAVSDFGRGGFIEREVPGFAERFQVTGDLVESLGGSVRIARQVDPVVIDVGLEESGADGSLGAELGDVA